MFQFHIIPDVVKIIDVKYVKWNFKLISNISIGKSSRLFT